MRKKVVFVWDYRDTCSRGINACSVIAEDKIIDATGLVVNKLTLTSRVGSECRLYAISNSCCDSCVLRRGTRDPLFIMCHLVILLFI